MTKGQLLAILYERLNYQGSPATEVVTRLGNHLNQAQRMILRQPGVTGLRALLNTASFVSEATVNYYGLPPAFGVLRGIADATNRRRLQPMALADARAIDPPLSTSGTPYAYVNIGLHAVKRLPIDTGLWAASASAADTTQVIQCNGARTGGLMTGDQTATLTGVTRVAIGAFTDWTDVTTISLSAVCAGLVSLYDAVTSGNVIAQIPIGHLYPQYVGVVLFPRPASVITYHVDGDGRIVDMDDTVDVPQLPEEFHDLLIPAAMMLEYEKTNDSRYPLAVATYREGLASLRHYLSAGPDAMPVMGGGTQSGSSRLGPWYPAD
jgi:hypothetical protein